MSKKRVADNYLTDQNWNTQEENDEDESEQAAEPFKPASEEILSKRTFKKAARRIKGGDKDKAAAANPFAVFGGFGGGPAVAATFGSGSGTGSATFGAGGATFGSAGGATFGSAGGATFGSGGASFGGFGAKVAESTLGKASSFSTISTGSTLAAAPIPTENTFKFTSAESNLETKVNGTETQSKEVKAEEGQLSSEQPSKSEEEKDYSKLANLNISVLKWIEKHVDENASVNLLPVFNDYTKHLNAMSV